MTLDEYLRFLQQYWELFTPPAEPKPRTSYHKILL